MFSVIYVNHVKGIQIQEALQFSILFRKYVKRIHKIRLLPKKINNIFKGDTESLTIYTFSKNNAKGVIALSIAISNIFKYICKRGTEIFIIFHIFSGKYAKDRLYLFFFLEEEGLNLTLTYYNLYPIQITDTTVP